MANKPNFKIKDVKKEFSSRDVSGVKEDAQGYFRGILESVDLIEATYIDDNKFDFSNKKRGQDEGKKIQLDFKFNLYTDTKEVVEKHIRTGTTFNKKIISQTYKSRGNKVMNSVFNKFTEMCLRLHFITPDEFREYEGLITNKIDEVVKSYNDRKPNDKIMIAAKYTEDSTYNNIDWLEMIYVTALDYKNDNIEKRLEAFKAEINKSAGKKEED